MLIDKKTTLLKITPGREKHYTDGAFGKKKILLPGVRQESSKSKGSSALTPRVGNTT